MTLALVNFLALNMSIYLVSTLTTALTLTQSQEELGVEGRGPSHDHSSNPILCSTISASLSTFEPSHMAMTLVMTPVIPIFLFGGPDGAHPLVVQMLLGFLATAKALTLALTLNSLLTLTLTILGAMRHYSNKPRRLTSPGV